MVMDEVLINFMVDEDIDDIRHNMKFDWGMDFSDADSVRAESNFVVL
mgnify:CR=1 FL=1